MFSSIIFAVVFLGMILASTGFWALSLRLGLRWAKVPDVTMRRVVVAAVIVAALQIVLNVLFVCISWSTDPESIMLGLAQLVASVVVPCAAISIVFKARLLRAFQAWIPTLLSSIATIAFTFLVLRPFIFEAFIISANSMAPTLIGPHSKAICTQCGSPNYCGPKHKRYGATRPSQMICDNFHVTEVSHPNRTVQAADRLMVAKFLTPQRWDLIVFQSPENPQTMTVKRLVGMPGEMIQIADGCVWADGSRLAPPDSLRGIEYLPEIPDWNGSETWGSANRPAQLGDDEYFVLGDFSANSLDSRFWEQGAPNHNAFAVPQSHLLGVGTHTYWPIPRWRIHR